MNGRSSLVTPNRARTRPSESSISISPARMTRFLIIPSQLGPTPALYGSCPWVRSLGRLQGRAGEGTGTDTPPDARNRRDPKVTAVSHGAPYEVCVFAVKPETRFCHSFP